MNDERSLTFLTCSLACLVFLAFLGDPEAARPKDKAIASVLLCFPTIALPTQICKVTS